MQPNGMTPQRWTKWLLVLAAARVILHALSNDQYGFHRDELATLDDARNLDWGFVTYPPLTPLFARLSLTLFGPSLVGFRFFATVAVSLAMVLGGAIAAALGGKRRTQLVAAIAVGIAPVSLIQGTVMQYVSFDYVWGVLATYFLVRLTTSDDPRWWVAIGGALGLGMQTRYTAGFLALGIAAAVLTSARRYLRSGWLWAGAALALLVFLPNLIWQVRHDFISLAFLSHIHARDVSAGRADGFMTGQLIFCVNLVTVPLVLMGARHLFGRAGGHRLVGWAAVVTLALFAATRARFYYPMPLYPVLIASGAVAGASWRSTLRPAAARAVGWFGLSMLVSSGVACALLLLPLAPIGSRWFVLSSARVDTFREEIGWPDLVDTIARVFHSLPTEEQTRAGILVGNYGEAGAVNLFGPAKGLPTAISGTNSAWLRGYPEPPPQTLIVVGLDRAEVTELFTTCERVARNGNRYGIVNEESADHPDIFLCRDLRLPWPQFWRTFRRFG
jgi:hypothetical protein